MAARRPVERRRAASATPIAGEGVSARPRASLALLAAVLSLGLPGCVGPAVLAGVGAAASIAGAAHSFLQVGEDIVSAVSIACQDVPAAKAASAALVRRGVRSVPAHMSLVAEVDGLCGRVAPSTIDAASPAWVGQVVAKMEAPVP